MRLSLVVDVKRGASMTSLAVKISVVVVVFTQRSLTAFSISGGKGKLLCRVVDDG